MQTQPNETIKRDKLAVQRTELANERTILAYIRTSLSFIGFGVLILKLFMAQDYHYLAIASIVMGVVIMVVGIVSYRRHKKNITENAK